MIVRRDESGFLLITQPAHAALACEVMTRWRADGLQRRAHLGRILAAVREHDNGWLEVDKAPLLDPDTGAPFDFVTAPTHVRQGVWGRGIERATRMYGVYEAALIAHHAITVYDRYRDDPAWRAFFGDLRAQRDALLREAGAPPMNQFLEDYAIVGVGDLISLVFCAGWDAPYDAFGYRLERSGDRVRISPDPFEGAAIALRAPGRRLPPRRYAAEAELQEAYAAAPVVWLEGEAAGA
jgi:hypothetical protein